MTKLRPPLTFDNALSRIAGQIGWEAMANTVGLSERTVRDWGDHDVGRGCPVPHALALDLAFMAAGGGGAPMFETYALLIEQANAERFSCQIELARRTVVAIREGGEAKAALVAATIPGAGAPERLFARREVEQAISALTATLHLLEPPAPP